MNCPKCNTIVEEGTRFCTSCGAQMVSQQPQFQQPQYQPQYNQPQYQQAAFAGAPNMYANQPIRKKKSTGLWITVFILLAVIAGLVFAVYTTFFRPKNLGIKYTQADFDSAMSKIGLNITFDGKSGSELVGLRKSMKNQSYNLADYNYELKDYAQKKFTLTPAEATAFMNEVAPGFFWFKNIQVNVLPGGILEGSSTVDITKIKNELYIDVADQVPIPLPSSLNIYSKGDLKIVNNKIEAVPEKFMIGPAPLPGEFMTPDAVDVMEEYFGRIYTIIPEVKIDYLGVDSNGDIAFDGYVPQTIIVTPKN